MSQVPVNSSFCHYTLVWWERMVRLQGRAPLVLTGSLRQDTAQKHWSCRLCPSSQFSHLSLPKGNIPWWAALTPRISCSATLGLSYEVVRLNLPALRAVSAQGQCLWGSESREIPPTGMCLTHHNSFLIRGKSYRAPFVAKEMGVNK